MFGNMNQFMADAIKKARAMKSAKSLEKPKMDAVATAAPAAPIAPALVKPMVQSEVSQPKGPSTPPDKKPMAKAFSGFMRGMRGF